jgi:hypothetical protein
MVLKWEEHEADHLPLSGAKIKNAGSFIPIPTYIFMEQCLSRKLPFILKL